VVSVDVAWLVVEVELLVLPAGADVEVGGEPTAAAGTTDAAGRWGEEEGTPPYALARHCWMKLPWPSSSCLPCAQGSYHP
jgi:hypothetical protein